MKINHISSIFMTGAAGFLILLQGCNGNRVEMSQDPLTPLSFEDVELRDSFWLPRLKTQKETLVPFSLDKTRPAVENLRRVGAYLKEGKKENLLPLPRYVASDLFKVMEGLRSPRSLRFRRSLSFPHICAQSPSLPSAERGIFWRPSRSLRL